MERDDWPKHYGQIANARGEAQCLAAQGDELFCDAQSVDLAELIRYLDDVIPAYGDEDSSELQFILQMARVSARKLLAVRGSRKSGECIK